MAAVTPVFGNKCIGTFEDGTENIQLYCNKGNDQMGDPIFTCATWRLFKVQCPKVNSLCSNLSNAYVAAITVCNQKLF